MKRSRGQDTKTILLFPAIALALFLLSGVSGCGVLATLGFNIAQSLQIVHKSDRLTLAWDPPVTDLPRSPSQVASYRILYRARGEYLWKLIDEIPAAQKPQYTITYGQLEGRTLEFAVQAIAVNGLQSPYHSSLDDSAEPLTGWYILWIDAD